MSESIPAQNAQTEQSLAKVIRVELPAHLRTLAGLPHGEVAVTLQGPATQRTLLDALETRFPMLQGTIRQHGSLERRPFLRFFACETDLSHQSSDALLPDAVSSGREVFLILGAIAGG